MTAAPPPTLGFACADWVEQFCVHGPGDMQGAPVVLTEEALRFLLDAYELDPVSGRRRYRRAMLVRPKGWAKSELAAFVALFEALGPARFDRWDDDGAPVGRAVRTPVVRVVATEEQQAGNVYDVVHLNLVEGPLSVVPGLDIGLTRVVLPGGGSVRPVTAGAASKDGGRETFVVFDELHLFTLPELHRLHQTYLRNLRKRHAADPWSLETTTAYRPGERSVAETAMGYAAKIASGEALDAGFLYDHRQPGADLDLDDPGQRRAALAQAYGDCDWVDFEQIVSDWDDPTTDRVDWRRYYLSQVVVGSDAFLDPAEWAAVADPEVVLADGDTVCLGLDTSLVDDATALVVCRVGDGLLSVLGCWQKPRGRDGLDWSVPYDQVDAAVRSAFDRFRVLRLYADPQYAWSLLDGWGLLFGQRRVVPWATNRPKPMAAALGRFHAAVRQRDGIVHSGEALLAEHVGNARVRMSQGMVGVAKEERWSPRKIDALIAAVLAFEAAADSRTAGEDRQVERRVYRAAGF